MLQELQDYLCKIGNKPTGGGDNALTAMQRSVCVAAIKKRCMMGREEGLSRMAKALLYLGGNADKDTPEAKRRLRGIFIDTTSFSKFHHGHGSCRETSLIFFFAEDSKAAVLS